MTSDDEQHEAVAAVPVAAPPASSPGLASEAPHGLPCDPSQGESGGQAQAIRPSSGGCSMPPACEQERAVSSATFFSSIGGSLGSVAARDSALADLTTAMADPVSGTAGPMTGVAGPMTGTAGFRTGLEEEEEEEEVAVAVAEASAAVGPGRQRRSTWSGPGPNALLMMAMSEPGTHVVDGLSGASDSDANLLPMFQPHTQAHLCR